ncbi:MAG: hypothetical protein COU07_02605 [Candidatus Harrisonbacteria bacterium CG10_big_fil_rev_8_21_14_0_10_40_38]|uniref:Uncharacterized protein n=1 Tax=Candidatus Harrisonbacteria bacterium CG10_big_fil_rev_8_21_14_0_10_40_38 TaxID=1974583 RepID=A0A2H0UTW8_9BACT|nr:MAG: hypothetical protein COU07_02605 [Candidatus Harrisonbacteria bacterium CG10_big_fil_rev_8_21_14_0_10_40_38]
MQKLSKESRCIILEYLLKINWDNYITFNFAAFFVNGRSNLAFLYLYRALPIIEGSFQLSSY